MNNYKPCKQCGVIKPLDQYRKYYGGRKGNYNTCKMCEKINSREKYLASKETLADEEQVELNKIYEVWSYQVKLGLRPPRKAATRTTKTVADSLDEMVDKYSSLAQATERVIPEDVAAPPELISWLYKDLTEEPEYYQDYVYDGLQRKYRQQLYIDTATMLPVYDDTYRIILQKILARFDKYEDDYYEV